MGKINRFGNMFPPEEKMRRPYLLWRKPFRIAGNLYFVGNEWCSSHLIDTGDGLLLLDTPCASALPGLLYSISYLGFQPRDLRYILVSHAHVDHYGAVSALVHFTGARTYLGAVDAKDMRVNRDRLETMHREMGQYEEFFVPDVELEDGDIIHAGNTDIRCVLTPGHTVGVMSHFWTLEHEGQTYHVGIYGGAGFISLSKEALEANGQPLSIRDDFAASIDKVWNEPVDITLGNHPFHNDTYPKYERMQRGERNPFIDPAEWHRFLSELKEEYRRFLPKSAEEIREENARSQWDLYY